MTQRDRPSPYRERERSDPRGYGEGYATHRMLPRQAPWEEEDLSAYRRSGAEPYADTSRAWDDLDDGLPPRRTRASRGRGYDETEFYSGQGADYVPQRRYAVAEDVRWQDPSRAYGQPEPYVRRWRGVAGEYDRGRYAGSDGYASRAAETPRIGQGGFAHPVTGGAPPYYGEGRHGVEPGPYVYGSTAYGAPGDASDLPRARGYRGRGPRNYTRSDARITEDLNERLTEDDYFDAGDVTVSVKDGVATLDGTVESRWMRHRAEDIAAACSGVRDVRNELRVGSASLPQSIADAAAGARGGMAH